MGRRTEVVFNHWSNRLERVPVSQPRRECGYCLAPTRGYGSLTIGDDTVYLCHADEGQDCYRLVTVYHKPLADGRRLDGIGTRWLARLDGSRDA